MEKNNKGTLHRPEILQFTQIDTQRAPAEVLHLCRVSLTASRAPAVWSHTSLPSQTQKSSTRVRDLGVGGVGLAYIHDTN